MNSQALREHLFAALKGIQDGTVTLEKAKAVGEISQVVINLAKVEVDFVRANGGGRSDFFPSQAATTSHTTPSHITVQGNKTIHRLVG